LEKELREQGIITPQNTVKENVFIQGYKRIRIFTHPREYKYMESDDDQIQRFVTLESADPWQRQILEILKQYPDD
jgi:hypothetical protein